MDMSKTIEAKSDQLNADDLLGGPRTIKITDVSGNDDIQQPVNIYFEGDNGKPYRPCKSMRRVMVNCWGADAKKYVGRLMTIYRDPDVTYGGMKVGGIRISHMSHIEKSQVIVLAAAKSKRAPFTVGVLRVDEKPAFAELSPQEIESAQSEARAAAEVSKAEFDKWWKDNPQKRPAAKLILDELKSKCAESDARNAPQPQDDDIPM